jgi:hypothetical protein
MLADAKHYKLAVGRSLKGVCEACGLPIVSDWIHDCLPAGDGIGGLLVENCSAVTPTLFPLNLFLISNCRMVSSK